MTSDDIIVSEGEKHAKRIMADRVCQVVVNNERVRGEVIKTNYRVKLLLFSV